MATAHPHSGIAAAAALLLATLLWLTSSAAFGWTEPTGAGFNHASTGYPLTGAHAKQSCESCHLGGRMKGTPHTCESCHTAGSALSKANVVMPQKHVPAVVGCGECHNTQSFTRTKFRHSVVSTVGCQTCHTGLGATGKTPRHVAVPAGQQCGDCHRSTRSWLPAAFNHTQLVVANNCFSCHDGRHDGATGRPATHVPGLFVVGEGINNCDTCHLDGFGFRSWTPARTHQFTHIKSQCATCHTGAFPPAVAQPSTPSHVGASPQCETCHRSTRNWLDIDLSAASGASKASVVRSGGRVAAVGTAKTNLLAAATVLPPRHIPLAGGALCTSCHRSARDMATAVVMNHRVVGTLDCKTCHNGTYAAQGAQTTPGQHIPYKTMLLNGTGMDCDDCHKGFTGASWSAVKMNHNGTMGGGAGSCKGCHQQGVAFQGQMEKKTLAHVSRSQSALDCSSSGCHGPLGRTGARFRSWR